jgi:hypothetical protein
MATVSNIRLQIGQEEQRNRRRVTVSYRVCFSNCEAMADSVFRETVTLRGEDPFWDQHLITLRSTCIEAIQGCRDRSVIANVAESVLDEDKDTIILGWVLGNEDEVYARVTLTPFTPSGSSGDSNIVRADFGPAGG